jgi:hypothetical protein
MQQAAVPAGAGPQPEGVVAVSRAFLIEVKLRPRAASPSPYTGRSQFKEQIVHKTIVVHVDDSAQLQPRPAMAAALAGGHGSHLAGSAVTGASQRNYLMFSTSPMAALPDSDFDLLRQP